ncbi:MAG: hypothetical protein EPN38_07380 [Rhodanobacteraceae bacterium]|nr:MAG: hypothetical protein EPN38_07380 [Rhodanobacteraceae bacterium]
MNDRTVLGAGIAAAVLCCGAPALVTLLGVFGLSAWVGKSSEGLLPALIVLALVVVVGIAGYAWYRRKHAAACCTPKTGLKYHDGEKHEQL